MMILSLKTPFPVAVFPDKRGQPSVPNDTFVPLGDGRST